MDVLAREIALLVVGMILGSFFGMAGSRIPAKQPIANRRSVCDTCRHRLSLCDTIPVIGWLTLRGSCRHCGQPIPFVYLCIELGGGVIFAALPLLLSSSSELWIAYPLASLLLILSVTDLRFRLLPNRIVYPAIVIFMALRLWIHPLSLWEYALGFVIGGGVLLAVSWAAEMLGKPGMGGGDIKLMALIGLVVGAKLVLLALFLSSLFGGLAGLILIAAGKLNRAEGYLPYGPFIGLGGLLSFLFGNGILAWYFRLLIM